MSSREQIEDALARQWGRRCCVLTNRGTTALAAAFHALGRPKGTGALFPAVMCSIPVFAARFAGWAPRFADVNLNDANFDLNSVEDQLKRGGVGAVVPVHMFGKPDDVRSLSALAGKWGASLVEDVALSMGAERDGKPVGSWGRVACLSFVRKMLPLEMGGALLTDEEPLAKRARAFVDAAPREDPSRREETSAAMKAFHSATGFVAAGGWRRGEILAPFEQEFRRLLLASTGEEDWAGSIVLEELAALPDVLQARRVRAEVYENVLGEDLLRALDRTGSSLFAYPVRWTGGLVEDFLVFSANQGYTFRRVAYPDIHRLFTERSDFPNAEILERELMGLPLDDDQPVSSFWSYAQDFRAMVEAYREAAPSRPPVDWRGTLALRMGSVL